MTNESNSKTGDLQQPLVTEPKKKLDGNSWAIVSILLGFLCILIVGFLALIYFFDPASAFRYVSRTATVYVPEPTSTPFVMPRGDFEMSWNIYNSEYNTSGGILTIRRQGSQYTEKIVMSDGSSGVYDLTVISEESEIKLTGHLGITSSLYGDYMVIRSTGELAFYDDQGYIYGVPPLR